MIIIDTQCYLMLCDDLQYAYVNLDAVTYIRYMDMHGGVYCSHEKILTCSRGVWITSVQKKGVANILEMAKFNVHNDLFQLITMKIYDQFLRSPSF